MTKATQQTLIDSPADSGPVECLGMTFENDAARREYFLGLLAEKLKDPEFRKIEGFPVGDDEDILALSDPPYYTACPNPWIADFIEHWSKDTRDCNYHREPFAADVSEGKSDVVYTAHSYHTKVPHKAIIRYLLHYTEPGQVVFDGFCGTGMMGVAAQLCSDRKEVESLGYKVNSEGDISKESEVEGGKKEWIKFSKLGIRRAILSDLSPIATFIAWNYTTPIDVATFEKNANRLREEVYEECRWMFETTSDSGGSADVIFTVWSDVFLCNECGEDVVFWDAALDPEAGKVKDKFRCPSCNSELSKRSVDKSTRTELDPYLKEVVKTTRSVPVLINYKSGTNRASKTPNDFDLKLIEKINKTVSSYWVPVYPMLFKGSEWGDTWRAGVHEGITHIHQFYTNRNLISLATLRNKVQSNRELFLFTGIACRSSQMNRIHMKNYFFGGGGWNAGYLKGTLYVSSIPIETSVFGQLRDRQSSFVNAFKRINATSRAVVSTNSMTRVEIPENSVDYLFLDPPFGANIMYSELNFLWESWLKVWTHQKFEAIENDSQEKDTEDYRNLMRDCFREAYRVLKPGRWITVEFSNTRAAVWNAIQSALAECGFIVANVSALDKKQKSFKAVNTPTAVKQDLVISAYKPNGGFEDRFAAGMPEENVWDFVETHLRYLPVTKMQKGAFLPIGERDARILFDQLVSYYVRKGLQVPMSSQEFQFGLAQKFPERDGMYFLPEQVAEYDRQRIKSEEIAELSLFVKDERTAIQWLRRELRRKPQTSAELNPLFMKQLAGWSKNEESLELIELLEQNFLCHDGDLNVPEQIHAYLSSNWKKMRNLEKSDPELVKKAKGRWYAPDPTKQSDLEKLREKSLLREFRSYADSKGKLKVFRTEAIRVGFTNAWQEQDYNLILSVATRLPDSIIEEDPALLMYYDNALMRTED